VVRGDRGRAPAWFALGVAAVGWSLGPVFIRMLRDSYDPYSQAFLRYAFGALALLPVTLCWHREQFLRLLLRSGSLFGLAVVTVLQHLTWTVGCYGAQATVAQLISKLSVVFTIVLAYVLFREERGVITSRGYLAGTALSLVGVAAVLADKPGSLAPTANVANVLLLITSVLWAVYVVWAKYAVTDAHPVPVFAVVAVYTSALLLVAALVFGEPGRVVAAGPGPALLAFASGLLPLAISHPCYYYAQKELGAAFCGTVNLTNPLMTYVFTWLLPPVERLLPSQWVGGIVLLAGTLFVVRTGQMHVAGDTVPPDQTTAK